MATAFGSVSARSHSNTVLPFEPVKLEVVIVIGEGDAGLGEELPAAVQRLAQSLHPVGRGEVLAARIGIDRRLAAEHVQPFDHALWIRQQLFHVLVGRAAGEPLAVQHPRQLVRRKRADAAQLHGQEADGADLLQGFHDFVSVVAVIANRVHLDRDSFLFHAGEPTTHGGTPSIRQHFEKARNVAFCPKDCLCGHVHVNIIEDNAAGSSFRTESGVCPQGDTGWNYSRNCRGRSSPGS